MIPRRVKTALAKAALAKTVLASVESVELVEGSVEPNRFSFCVEMALATFLQKISC